jgi:rod shape-determining protein MreD
MHWTRLALVILLAAILQLVIDNTFSNFAFRPDLLVIVMVFLAMNSDGYWPIISAFAAGFAADLISPMCMGAHTIAFGVSGSLLALARRTITLDNAIYIALAVFVLCGLAGAITQILVSIRQQTPVGTWLSLLWASMASAIIGPYVYSILSAASGLLGTKQHRGGRRGK